MSMEHIKKGTVVRVTAGKEKNSIFIVVEDLNVDRVSIADGRHRKRSRPKLKNVKHLEAVGALTEVPERDRLIWKSLSSFRG